MVDKDRLRRQTRRSLNIIDTEVQTFISRLRSFISQEVERTLGDIIHANDSALGVANALGGLRQSLTSLGLGEVFASLDEVYGVQLAEIQAQFEASSNSRFILNDVDLQITQQLIRYDTDIIGSQFDIYVDELKSAVFRSVVAGQRPDIREVSDELSRRLLNNVTTELNTALLGFSRTVTLAKAEESDLTHFLYIGGIIQTSREFCRERDGHVFTRQEIDSWDNGQGLPAAIYLGGYNCRHRLLPVTKQRARELGV